MVEECSEVVLETNLNMCRPPSLRAFKRVSGEDKSVGNGLDTVNIVDCGKSVIYSE